MRSNLLIPSLLLPLAWALAGCSNDARSDPDSDEDLTDGDPTDPNGDGGGTDETDTDQCTEPSWAEGFTIGEPVANWSFEGYIDSDKDGTVEPEVVEFDMADINCMGYSSIVLVSGTTS